VKEVKLTQIKVAETRHRRQFAEDKLAELAESILRNGLLHPPVVAEEPEGQYTLISGERRLRAVKQLHAAGKSFTCNGAKVKKGCCPVLFLADCSELGREEAELDENIIRVDLTWQEVAEATKRLHELRKKQKGAQTMAETAAELTGKPVEQAKGYAATQVQENIFLADFLDDPEVGKAASRADALRKAKKKVERELKGKLVELAEQARAESGSGAGAAQPRHRMLVGDAHVLLPEVKEKVSCIVTDPPYGVEADTFDFGQARQHTYSDSREEALKCYQLLAEQGPRLMAEGGHLYAFCHIAMFYDLADIFDAAGWSTWRTPLIWVKGVGHIFSKAAPRRTYDAIIFTRYGARPCVEALPDVIQVPAIKTIRRAEKPVAVYENLLRRSVLPGETVLDPFAGTGPIFPAANSLHLRAIGIEKDSEAAGYAKSRFDERMEATE